MKTKHSKVGRKTTLAGYASPRASALRTSETNGLFIRGGLSINRKQPADSTLCAPASTHRWGLGLPHHLLSSVSGVSSNPKAIRFHATADNESIAS